MAADKGFVAVSCLFVCLCVYVFMCLCVYVLMCLCFMMATFLWIVNSDVLSDMLVGSVCYVNIHIRGMAQRRALPCTDNCFVLVDLLFIVVFMYCVCYLYVLLFVVC